MKILVINGPNLNMLGSRDTDQYGRATLEGIRKDLNEKAASLGVELAFFQSNHEGAIIDFIQKESLEADGILINPGALTHCGYSLHDALADYGKPVVELHLSNIHAREVWRRRSVIADATIGEIAGFREESYLMGLEALVKYIRSQG